jgi:hypothetical protein
VGGVSSRPAPGAYSAAAAAAARASTLPAIPGPRRVLSRARPPARPWPGRCCHCCRRCCWPRRASPASCCCASPPAMSGSRPPSRCASAGSRGQVGAGRLGARGPRRAAPRTTSAAPWVGSQVSRSSLRVRASAAALPGRRGARGQSRGNSPAPAPPAFGAEGLSPRSRMRPRRPQHKGLPGAPGIIPHPQSRVRRS